MDAKKKKQIEEQLLKIEERLANAEEYVARNINVEGRSFLHHEVWRMLRCVPSGCRHGHAENARDRLPGRRLFAGRCALCPYPQRHCTTNDTNAPASLMQRRTGAKSDSG